MKRIIWIVLVIGAVAQPLSRTGIYMLFQVNRAYIASHLCEQRQVPASDCQGKCYLKKQLKQEEQREQQTPVNQKQNVPDLTLMAASFRLCIPYLPSLLLVPVPDHAVEVYISPVLSIFQPPECMT